MQKFICFTEYGWILIILISCGIGVLLWGIIDIYPKWLSQYWRQTAYDYLIKNEGHVYDKHQYGVEHYDSFLTYAFKQSRQASYCAVNTFLPVIEVITVALTVGIIGYFSVWLPALLLCYFLLILMCIDLQKFLLPDAFTLSLLWLGLLVNLTDYFVTLEHAVFGVICGYLSLWVIYWGVKLFFHIESIGYGDFKLLAALGAWFGWQKLPEIVLLASISALFVTGCIALYCRDRTAFKKPIAFGAYLALAGIVMLFKIDG